jgi:hypothetical protein
MGLMTGVENKMAWSGVGVELEGRMVWLSQLTHRYSFKTTKQSERKIRRKEGRKERVGGLKNVMVRETRP